MGKEITFNIKFITPLLLHGADSRTPDELGLAKALRGAWRFWFRAVAGGMVDNISPGKLHEYESQVFGSADERYGAKFRMLVERIHAKPSCNIPPGFNTRFLFAGFDAGSEFAIKIMPRKDAMSPDQRNALLCAIWLWGNLGALGQRARRGFGSPVIVERSDKCFAGLALSPENTFKSDKDLEQHLIDGLRIVWDKISEDPDIRNIKSIKTDSLPQNTKDCFFLRSLGQVAVSGNKMADLNSILQNVHGDSSCGELGYIGRGRLASPVFVRLHQVDNQFYPVMTWSEPKDPADARSCARRWLNDRGFQKYLSGKTV